MAKKGVMPPSVKPGKPILTECPPEWKRGTYADLFSSIGRPIKLHDDKEYQLVTVKRSRGGVVRREVLEGRDIKTKSAYELRGGDFLISNRQIVHGACGTVPPELDGAIVSGEYTVLSPKNGTSMDYVRHLSHSLYFQQSCYHASIGVDIEKMVFKLDRWFKTPIHFPNAREQHKIAEILSCWDEALLKYDRYLTSLSSLKRGILQQYIVDRNSKDQSNCAFVKLRDVATFVERGVTPSYSATDTTFPVLNQKAIRWGKIDATALKYVTPLFAKRVESALRIKSGDIVINSTGDITIGRAYCFSETPRYLIPDSHVTLIRTTNVIIPEFLVAVFETPEGQHQIYSLVNGSTGQIELPPAGIKSFSFFLPSLDVQKRVVKVLTAIQEAQSKTQALISEVGNQKQALMQKLLTGKIRIKV